MERVRPRLRGEPQVNGAGAARAPDSGWRASARIAGRLNGWTLLILPAVVLVVVCFAFPVFEILSRAFTDHTSGDTGAFSNFDWYFGDATQLTILRRTFTTAVIVTAISLCIAYPFAYLLTSVSPRARLLLLGVVVVALWQSVVVRNFAWRILLREDGIVSHLAGASGLGESALLGTTAAVIIGMVHFLVPVMILPLYASMRNVDRRLVTAAESLGASPASAFLRVYLPLTLPGVVAGCLLVFVISLGFFITPALLGSPQNSLISQAIVFQTDPALDWGRAGAMSLVLLTITLIAVAGAALLIRKRLRVITGGGLG